MSENKNNNKKDEELYQFRSGYVLTDDNCILNYDEENKIKLTVGEELIYNGNINIYTFPNNFLFVHEKAFEVKVKSVKFTSTYFHTDGFFASEKSKSGDTQSIFVVGELDYNFFKSNGYFIDFKFIESEEDYNIAKEIGYNGLVERKTRNAISHLGYGDKFIQLIIYKFSPNTLYDKIKLIETMESENIPKKLIVFSILSDNKFDIKDILNFGGNIYEQ